jgi:hypothetical protein
LRTVFITVRVQTFGPTGVNRPEVAALARQHIVLRSGSDA